MSDDDIEFDPNRPNATWSAIRGFGRIASSTYLRYRIRGLEHVPHRGGALLLVNHQSFLDPVLLGLSMPRPVSFLARRNLFEIPVVGWILRNTYVIPLDREAVSPSSIKEAVRRLRAGFLVGIFAEGTRTTDGRVAEFQSGFLTLVRRGKVPVIPAGIAGAFESYPRGGKFPRPATVRTVVGEPLGPDVMSLLDERRNDEFVQVARERVVGCFQEAEAWRRGW